MNAASLVINPALSPCVFLPPENVPDVYILVTAEHNKLDDGAFYLKVHPRSVDLLTRTLNHPLARPENDLGWSGEHAAFATVIRAIEAEHRGSNTPSGIAWIPRPWINNHVSKYNLEAIPSSFIVHIADTGGNRQAHMATWLHELRRNQDKWEISLEDLSSLKADIIEFWSDFAARPIGKD